MKVVVEEDNYGMIQENIKKKVRKIYTKEKLSGET